MIRHIKIIVVSFTIYLLCPGLSAAQDQGSIRGTVVNENGAPIRSARVNANPVDSHQGNSLLRVVETDSVGHFLIDHLEWGKYRIFAMKEEAGYPNMRASFYSNDVYPTVVVDAAAPSVNVRVELGPKAGVLLGSITNAVSGAPVYADFRLSRSADRNKWISTSVPPHYRILLPPSTEVLLQVSAPGFKTWTSSAPLRFQSASETHLDVVLEPTNDPNLHPSKFLVPDGYVGWLQLEYGKKDAPIAPVETGLRMFKFPPSGVLETSSPGPRPAAQNQYGFYSENGSARDITADHANGKGMIWGEYQGSRGGLQSLFGFFVGSEEQYKKYQSQAAHPGPIIREPNPLANP